MDSNTIIWISFLVLTFWGFVLTRRIEELEEEIKELKKKIKEK